ncbi:MAG: HAD family hydrolase [bacterium]|nr:HAD family hydrolase [bacterium]
MRKAVFLDRDGTVLTLAGGTGYLSDSRSMRLLPGAARAIALLNKAGFLVFIHTNQAIVARGKLTEEKLQHIHKVLFERLKKQGAHIDALYYCPHHPEAKIKKYRVVCVCRKPKTGMLKKAIKDFNVDAKKSFMVGDSSKDILAGKRAGLQTILVKTGNAGREWSAVSVVPDFVEKNILAAAVRIKKAAK